MSNSAATQLSVATKMYGTYPLLKLIPLQVFSAMVGRLLELVGNILSFEIMLQNSGDYVGLAEIVFIQALILLFEDKFPQAFWEYAQAVFGHFQLKESVEGIAQEIQVIMLSGIEYAVVFSAISYPLCHYLFGSLLILPSVQVEAYLIVALSPVLSFFSYCQENVFQVQNRFIMVCMVRVVGPLIYIVLVQLCVMSQRQYKETYFLQIIQFVAFLCVIAWLQFWNTGVSVINITNRTPVPVTRELYRGIFKQLKRKIISQFRHYFACLARFVMYASEAVLMLVSLFVVQKFSKQQIERKNQATASLYFFYVFGQLFKAAQFAAEQASMMNTFMFEKNEQPMKVIKGFLASLLIVMVINTAIQLILKHTPMLRLFSGNNTVLLHYADEYRKNKDETLMTSMVMSYGSLLQDFFIIFCSTGGRYVLLFITGLSKIVVGVVSIIINYKYQFEQISLIRSYTFSEIIGILISIIGILYFWVLEAEKQHLLDKKQGANE